MDHQRHALVYLDEDTEQVLAPADSGAWLPTFDLEPPRRKKKS